MAEVTDFRDVEDRDQLREALLDQLAYLIDEVEALKTVVDTVPEEVQSGRPTGDVLSMREMYGAIAELDDGQRRRWVERVAAEDEPALEASFSENDLIESEWNERAIDAVLDAVQQARRRLVDALRELGTDDWGRTARLDGETVTLFDLAHGMAKDDMERLRDLGYRLHSADLSEDGPSPSPQQPPERSPGPSDATSGERPSNPF
jgi:hypothetical protein